jgi:hypothetical protein
LNFPNGPLIPAWRTVVSHPGGAGIATPELRDVIVVVAAPHDALVRRFVADLKQRGLPLARTVSATCA